MTLKGRQTTINKECRTTYFGKKDDIYFWNKEINLHLKNIKLPLKEVETHPPFESQINFLNEIQDFFVLSTNNISHETQLTIIT